MSTSPYYQHLSPEDRAVASCARRTVVVGYSLLPEAANAAVQRFQHKGLTPAPDEAQHAGQQHRFRKSF